MFAFAANRDYQGKPLRAKLAARPLEERAHSRGARIETLSKLLLAVARQHAADEGQARALAHTAFERLLVRDPELVHFWQVVGVLRDELEACEAPRSGGEAPLRAHCMAA